MVLPLNVTTPVIQFARNYRELAKQILIANKLFAISLDCSFNIQSSNQEASVKQPNHLVISVYYCEQNMFYSMPVLINQSVGLFAVCFYFQLLAACLNDGMMGLS